MECDGETLGRKAFRFGIFRDRFSAARVCDYPCLTMEISRIAVGWRARPDPAGAGWSGAVMRRLFCRASLDKVSGGWPGREESISVL
jgi:hypothetical protein